MPVECFLIERVRDGRHAYTFDDGRPEIVAAEEPPDWHVKAPLYRRVDTGEEFRRPPAGAMLDALTEYAYLTGSEDSYYHQRAVDGRAMVVFLPGGHGWFIDGRASNCTRPDDDEHRCWVREGEPPNLTVGKEGDTCAAGAGSIWAAQGQPDEWHGFLRGGQLVEA